MAILSKYSEHLIIEARLWESTHLEQVTDIREGLSSLNEGQVPDIRESIMVKKMHYILEQIYNSIINKQYTRAV